MERNGVQLHLSEHTGDATPNTLVYFWVDDVDSIAAEFGVEVTEQPWAREIQLRDPDGLGCVLPQATAAEDTSHHVPQTTGHAIPGQHDRMCVLLTDGLAHGVPPAVRLTYINDAP